MEDGGCRVEEVVQHVARGGGEKKKKKGMFIREGG